MRTLNSIISAANEALRPLLEEAFEAGRALGRHEATDEMKVRLASVLSGDHVIPKRSLIGGAGQTEPSPREAAPEEEGRAAPGTVKPRILKLIQDTPAGLATREITNRTGFKHNSVRGTLWTLKREGSIIERDGRWVVNPTNGLSNGEDNDHTHSTLNG